MALGVHLDLFPTVVSAVNGKVGYAPQVWLGIGKVRIRFVGAYLQPPDSFAFASGFKNPTTTALAVVFDYTFGSHFDGFWLGPGFELWQRSIQHEDEPGTARWTNLIATLGFGYIWRFSGNFYLDPWVGVHWTMNPYPVHLGTATYDPFPLMANASVKIGWFKDL
jgi:hypothetical protein